MNRNDEFTELMKELDEQVPEVGESIRKGSCRKARKQFLYQPLMGLAVVFMLFVLSVNLCSPVAEAVDKIPLLRDLANAVKYSKSLKAAVENDYAQEVYLTQTKDGVTVEITSMIVDKQELTVFYRIVSEEYDRLAAQWSTPQTRERKHKEIVDGTYVFNFGPEEIEEIVHLDEEMRYVRVKFYEEDGMPEKLPLCLTTWNAENYAADVQAGLFSETNYIIGWKEQAERYKVAAFEFELDLDLAEIPEPVIYEVNQTVELDGRSFTIEDIEVYPTYIHMNVLSGRGLDASLAWLYFYVENETGEIFLANSVENLGKRQYELGAESPFFSEGKLTKIVITGVRWLEQGKKAACINFTTGEASNLPEGVSLIEIRTTGNTYDMVFEMPYMRGMDLEKENPLGVKHWIPPFASYYDEEWNYYEAEERWEVERDEENNLVGESGIFEVRLENYPKEEVWLTNAYSGVWYAEEEVVIDIP